MSSNARGTESKTRWKHWVDSSDEESITAEVSSLIRSGQRHTLGLVFHDAP
jgi:hypothetical protein